MKSWYNNQLIPILSYSCILNRLKIKKNRKFLFFHETEILLFSGKGLYKDYMKQTYNWPANVPFRSLNNGTKAPGDAPRAKKEDLTKIYLYLMSKYEQVSTNILNI